MSAEDILAFFAESIMPYDMGNQVETFSSWVNPAAAPMSSLLDYLASVMNPIAAQGLHAASRTDVPCSQHSYPLPLLAGRSENPY
jgi:hypothetical protein